MPTTTASIAALPVQDWLLDYLRARYQLDMTPQSEWLTAERMRNHIDYRAARAAQDLNDGPTVAVVEPGDEYRYTFVLTRVTNDPTIPADLVVALPDFHRCLAISLGGIYHMPHYVAEKIGDRGPSPVVVAAFLTLLDAHLTGDA